MSTKQHESNQTQPSTSIAGGEGESVDGGDVLGFENLAHIDMSKMSQSELYSLSVKTWDLDNFEDPQIMTKGLSKITKNWPATSTFRDRRRRFGVRTGRAFPCSDDDDHREEDRLILSSLDKLIAEGEGQSSMSASQEMVVVENEGETHKKKKKSRIIERNVSELKAKAEAEGLGVIRVNGENVDLQFLACVGDNAFQEELKRMTKRCVTKEDLIEFLDEIEGRQVLSSKKWTREVDAAGIVKALPAGWKLFLAFRPRARTPSLYCRAFISPTGERFKSCKDAAFYLKAHLKTAVSHPPEEGEVKIILSGRQEPGHHQEQGDNELIQTTCFWCYKEFFCEPPGEGSDKDIVGVFCPACEEQFPRATQ